MFSNCLDKKNNLKMIRPPLDYISVERAQVQSDAHTQNANNLAPLMAEKLNISVSTNNRKEENGKEEFFVHDDKIEGTTYCHLNVANETIDWKKECEEMDKLFEEQAECQLKDLLPFVMPKRLKTTNLKLYQHQKDGIRWLIQQEQKPPPNPFIRSRVLKDGSTGFYDRFTQSRLHKPHPPVKGSILADDMGMGKTLQTLGLILSNPPVDHVYGMGDLSLLEDPVCTIIVCPKTVISNWLQQIIDFVEPDTFRVLTYTGTPKQRSKIVQKVRCNEVDILLSSYETVTSDYNKKRKGSKEITLQGIQNVNFHRIILDEAQHIRNPKSKCFKAISALTSKSKYCLALTGTPFVNKPDDIHSLLSLVTLEPLSDSNVFKRYITDPIKCHKRAGVTRLRAALVYVALRRTKNSVSSLDMVEKTVQVCRVNFPEGKHKNIHSCLFQAAKTAFGASINGSGKGYTDSKEGVTANAQRAMFSIVLMVRQSCASGALVSAINYERAAKVIQNMKDENGNIRNMQSAREGNMMLDIFQTKTPESNNNRLNVNENSPKICALLSNIKKMDKDEKGIIFSQWTLFLDIIETALKSAGHDCVRIDGSMSTEKRTWALTELNNNNDIRFILCSLKAAGVGINLTRANVVFMMDPWWNDAVEMQAIDRCHRMGQTRPVRVYRFVMKDTIEERMLNIQKAKHTLGKGTMAKLSKDEEKLAKVTSLKDLFQIKDSSTEDLMTWE